MTSLPAGYQRWLRAENNAATRNNVHSRLYRSRLEKARRAVQGVNHAVYRIHEVRGFGPVVNRYLCSPICAAMQLQLDWPDEHSELDLQYALVTAPLRLYTNPYSDTSHTDLQLVTRVSRDVVCRACHATITTDGTVDTRTRAIDFTTSLAERTAVIATVAEPESLIQEIHVEGATITSRPDLVDPHDVLISMAIASQGFIPGEGHEHRVAMLEWLVRNPEALAALRG
jgi:hypothetical protein